jgi:hypothetical protein
MEWFVLQAPVPGAVEFHIGAGTAFVAMLLAAGAPLFLAVRNALAPRASAPEVPQLRLIDGGKELSRRAA